MWCRFVGGFGFRDCVGAYCSFHDLPDCGGQFAFGFRFSLCFAGLLGWHGGYGFGGSAYEVGWFGVCRLVTVGFGLGWLALFWTGL